MPMIPNSLNAFVKVAWIKSVPFVGLKKFWVRNSAFRFPCDAERIPSRGIQKKNIQ
jgi:hypothetical protein